MPISIPTGVHIYTCSNRVSLAGVKLSLLRMSALHFQDGEAHAIFLCALLRTVSLAVIMHICIITVPLINTSCSSRHTTAASVARSVKLPLSLYNVTHGDNAAHSVLQCSFSVTRNRKLLLFPYRYSRG